METFIGLSLLFIFLIWYLVSNQNKRDRQQKFDNERLKILNGVKAELYAYALNQGKIGRSWVDAEVEGGNFPSVHNENDKIKIDSLVEKYERNIFNDKYATPIKVFRERLPSQFMATSFTITNDLKDIIPFLKREIDKFPKGKDYLLR